jgi:hypothetical protein
VLWRRRMGVVFFRISVCSTICTTYENVALPLRVQGRGGSELPVGSGGAAALGRILASGCMCCRRCCRAARNSGPPSRAR